MKVNQKKCVEVAQDLAQRVGQFVHDESIKSIVLDGLTDHEVNVVSTIFNGIIVAKCMEHISAVNGVEIPEYVLSGIMNNPVPFVKIFHNAAKRVEKELNNGVDSGSEDDIFGLFDKDNQDN